MTVNVPEPTRIDRPGLRVRSLAGRLRLVAAAACFFFAFGVSTAPAFTSTFVTTPTSSDEKETEKESESKEERSVREALRGGRPELGPLCGATARASLPDPLRGPRPRPPSLPRRTQSALDAARGFQRPHLC